ncbi:permease [Salidesulfovibrio brasiliensis]|uniref:permease n=1 Tax=Salidesulfovibrio brasiliensis TaxID=221711 RepID=UPI0006D1D218|nr:permease [Salidesulfovibrio brasiliensis]
MELTSPVILFASLVAAIVIEAAPFLLLGSLVAALFEAFVPEKAIERFIPGNPYLQVASGLFAGMLLPTCECGVVPVVRKFLARGVPPRAAIAYLFAAPVLNPVVLVSTWVAFRFEGEMVFWRALMVGATAAGLALAMAEARASDILKLPKGIAIGTSPSDPVHTPGCGCGHCSHDGKPGVVSILRHTGSEFLDMFRFLFIGAVLAAAFKTLIPPGMMQSFAASAPLSVGAMMLFAIVSSVCSEADAFVAAGFSALPTAAQLAFTAIGPMVDLKLIGMFFATFRNRVAVAFIVVPIVLIYLMAIIFHQAGVLP